MRQAATLAAFLVLRSVAAAASDAPRADALAGYSYIRSDDQNRHGWIGSGALNISDHFGIVGELAGHYGSADAVELRSLSFLAGPRFTPFRGTLTPFVHVLLGGVRARQSLELLGVSLSESKTRFGGLAGAGVDLRISDKFGVRVQGDLRVVRVKPAARGAGDVKTENDPRASAGIVYRCGER